MLAFAVIIDARPTVHLADVDPDLAVFVPHLTGAAFGATDGLIGLIDD